MMKCPKCAKSFKSQIALTMHDRRVHSKTIRVPGQNDDDKETAIMNEIVAGYASFGEINLARAYREHSEWEKAFAHKNQMTVRSRLHRIYKRSQKEPREPKPLSDINQVFDQIDVAYIN